MRADSSAEPRPCGGALRAMNETLASINGIIGAVHDLFQNVVYPRAAIARAQDLVAQVTALDSAAGEAIAREAGR